MRRVLYNRSLREKLVHTRLVVDWIWVDPDPHYVRSNPCRLWVDSPIESMPIYLYPIQSAIGWVGYGFVDGSDGLLSH